MARSRTTSPFLPVRGGRPSNRGRPRSRRPNEGVPSVRDRRTFRAAAKLDPTRRGRIEALASYVEALPADVDSLGGLRSCVREDAHLLLEAILLLRALEQQRPPGGRARRTTEGRGQR